MLLRKGLGSKLRMSSRSLRMLDFGVDGVFRPASVTQRQRVRLEGPEALQQPRHNRELFVINYFAENLHVHQKCCRNLPKTLRFVVRTLPTSHCSEDVSTVA